MWLLFLLLKIICCSGSLYSTFFHSESNHFISMNGYSNYFINHLSVEKNPYISIVSSYSFISSMNSRRGEQYISGSMNSRRGEQYISAILSYNFISSINQYSLSQPKTSKTFVPSTLAPTFVPTFVSSTFVPTLAPATFAPSTLAPATFAPSTLAPSTLAQIKTITFDTTVTLIGFSQPSLNEQEQTIYIIALSKSTNIEQYYIKIIKQQIAGRRLLHNIEVTTQITYPYVSNPQSIYQYLVQKIQTSVDKGNFSSYLTMVSLQYNISSFKNISIIGLSFSPLADDDGTTTGSSDHTILIITCISIVFSIWLLAIFCITQWKKRYKKYLLYAV
jgi:hypothetical protein